MCCWVFVMYFLKKYFLHTVLSHMHRYKCTVLRTVMWSVIITHRLLYVHMCGYITLRWTEHCVLHG